MKLFTIFLIILTASLLSKAANSVMYEESDAISIHKTHHHMKINCSHACKRRCKKSSRKNVCHRACKTCCKRCHCVPPGTYGNKAACPCYAALKTHGNKPKCP